MGGTCVDVFEKIDDFRKWAAEAENEIRPISLLFNNYIKNNALIL